MAERNTRQGPLFKKPVKEICISIRVLITGAIHMLKGLNVDANF